MEGTDSPHEGGADERRAISRMSSKYDLTRREPQREWGTEDSDANIDDDFNVGEEMSSIFVKLVSKTYQSQV